MSYFEISQKIIQNFMFKLNFNRYFISDPITKKRKYK